MQNTHDLNSFLDENLKRTKTEISANPDFNKRPDITKLKIKNIASFIDHTFLKPDASKNTIEKICGEALEYGFKTVCINPSNLRLAVQMLKESGVMPITVIGFPLGATFTESKVFETEKAVEYGAKEIDMVINVGALKSKDYNAVFEDIRSVVNRSNPLPVKVIIETSLLSEDEKIIASTLCVKAGAAFVKTSTGFSASGATFEDLRLIRTVVKGNAKIKASGGVRTLKDALTMISAGADRIGASSSVQIIKEFTKG